MNRIERQIDFGYIFDPTHKGAPYSFDGVHWLNNGEFLEPCTKWLFGYEMKKDANTPFDKGSDIPEINASVKSSKATLTSVKLGSTFEEIKRNYFERVHSTLWIYATMIEDKIVVYLMNKDEFAEFMDCFGTYCTDRQVIRFKSTSGKMIKWFEERVA